MEKDAIVAATGETLKKTGLDPKKLVLAAAVAVATAGAFVVVNRIRTKQKEAETFAVDA